MDVPDPCSHIKTISSRTFQGNPKDQSNIMLPALLCQKKASRARIPSAECSLLSTYLSPSTMCISHATPVNLRTARAWSLFRAAFEDF